MLMTDLDLDGKNARQIKSIGIAENAKIDGLAPTVRELLLGQNQSFAEFIKNEFKDCDEDIKNGQKAAYVQKIGLALTLPFTLGILGLATAGTSAYVMAKKLGERKNLEKLAKDGIIEEKNIETILQNVKKLDAEERTDVSYGLLKAFGFTGIEEETKQEK